MIEHLLDHQLLGYRSRTMPPADLVSANDHLFSCIDCFNRLQAMTGSRRITLTHLLDSGEQEAGSCLLYEQMKAYVDEEMPKEDRYSIEHHLSECRLCRGEVADLLLFKRCMDEEAAVHPVRSASIPDKPGPPMQAGRFLPHGSGWVAVGSVAAAALLAVAWLLIVMPLRNEINLLGKQVAAARENNAELQQTTKDNLNDLVGRLANLEKLRDTPLSEPSDISGGPKVLLNDGGRIIRLERGELEGFSDPYFARAVKGALESSRIAAPSLTELTGKQDILMGGGSSTGHPSLNSPVGKVLEDYRPFFSWSAVPGAVAYWVSIMDIRSRKIFKSPLVQGTQWQPGEPLSRGRIYSWSVKAVLSDGREVYMPAPPSAPARFRVLGQSEEQQLGDARGLTPPSHLLLGVLYARAGLLDSARKELQELADTNPKSRVAQKLLGSLETGNRH